jgi:hypothetical protein
MSTVQKNYWHFRRFTLSSHHYWQFWLLLDNLYLSPSLNRILLNSLPRLSSIHMLTRSLLMDLYWIYIVWLSLKLEHKMNMESQIQQLVVHLGNHHCPETHARWACELLCGCDLESMQEHGQGVVPRVMPNYFQKSQLLDGNEGPGYSAHPEKLDCWLLFQPSLRIFWEYYTSLKHKRKIGTVSDVTVSWINQWPLTFWQK